MIQATARVDTFVRVFEECALRAQYLLRARFAPGTEETLERASETSPVCCGHKDVLHGVANPSPAPALIALNIFNALIWKN